MNRRFFEVKDNWKKQTARVTTNPREMPRFRWEGYLRAAAGGLEKKAQAEGQTGKRKKAGRKSIETILMWEARRRE